MHMLTTRLGSSLVMSAAELGSSSLVMSASLTAYVEDRSCFDPTRRVQFSGRHYAEAQRGPIQLNVPATSMSGFLDGLGEPEVSDAASTIADYMDAFDAAGPTVPECASLSCYVEALERQEEGARRRRSARWREPAWRRCCK